MANDVFFDYVIAGSLKGRKLAMPKSDGVRPSKNRVKQAVFNLLTARIDWDGMVVLDLFCGSGAWGFEALSRGAGQVTLVDIDERAAAGNIKSVGAAHITAVSGDVRAWKPSFKADVVMLDPPYGKGLAQSVLNRAHDFGKSGSWWCVEAHRDDVLVWDDFDDVEFRDYGASRVWVAQQL